MEYDFTLKLTRGADGADSHEIVERLGAVGCTDALVGIGQPGRLALNFTREAVSAQHAILSALRDVRSAIPEATLLEVSPDFVGLTDVAELVGVTRQNMRKLMLAHSESFPVPVHEGSTSFWHLSPVLRWLKERGTYTIEQPLLDVAHIAMQINLAREAGQLERAVQRELRSLVA